MSIAVNMNDSGIAGGNRLSGDQSLTGQDARDLQNSFLTLLVAQLKNQDPTNPMDNSQLTSQLAQISTVNGVEKLNTTLNKISGKLDDSQSVQASGLIGHGVMVPGGRILVGGDSATEFGAELTKPAKQVIATITDRSGQVIDQIDLGVLTAGVHMFSWDGKQSNGIPVADGAYQLSLSAKNDDEAVMVQPLNFAKVIGLVRDNGINLLDLGTFGTAPLSSVRKIL